MVNKELLLELKKIMEAGPDASDPDYTLKAFDFISQVANEDDEIAEILKESDVLVQFYLDDREKYYWFRASKGEVAYGSGKMDLPDITLIADMDDALKILYGDADPVSLFMSGDIVIEGDYPKAVEFQDLFQRGLDLFKEMIKNI